MTTADKPLSKTEILSTLQGLSPEMRISALRKAIASATADRNRAKYKTPGDLAADIDRSTVQTPALKLIDKHIAKAIDTGGRLIISIPPQEGKSTRVSVWTPVWALMRNPDLRVVVASYAETLARRNAMQARALVAEHGTGARDGLTGAPLPDKLGIELADDHKRATSWALKNSSGGYYATGVGGSLTGRSADCVHEDAAIVTEYGETTAADAYQRGDKFILGFDHESGRPRWNTIQASRRIDGSDLVAVKTIAGNVLTCTPDHRIYCGGRYRPADSVRPGEKVLQTVSSADVSGLSRSVRSIGTRGSQSNSTRPETNMQHEVWAGLSIELESDSPLRQLRSTYPEIAEDDLLRRVPSTDSRAASNLQNMLRVRVNVPCDEQQVDLLRHDMRRQSALEAYDRSREQSLHTVDVTSSAVQQAQACDQSTGQQQVHRLWFDERPRCSSQGRELQEQQSRQPRDGVQFLSYEASQVEVDEIQSVAAVGTGTVYDFQTDGDHNFFADNLLVHNCLIVDDPVKNMVQADSAREREKVWEWWSSVALTRLAPGAAVIIIMTRWHPDDLVGRLLEQDKQLPPEQRVWDVINIPAIAEDGVPDALRRDYGESLTSARGRSRQDFIQIKQSVGDRVWSALYQGVPVPISGGLFSADEIERTRGSEEQRLVGRIVSVDPSESGHGDEAGVLVMGWDAEGTIWVEADHSRPMRSAVWARTAVDLALSNQCGALVYEAFTAKETYRNVIEQAWRDIRDNARLLRKHDLDVVAAFDELTAGKDFFADADDEINPLESLNRVLDIIDFVPDQDVPPFLVVPWTAKGDKVARAAGARQSVSIGKLRMAGTHNVLETQMKTWQQGQGSPDRVDALVNGHDHIAQQIQAQSDVAFPGDY